MKNYALYDAEIAYQIQKSILRQMWYLTEQVVVFSLFDNSICDDDKHLISQTLLRFPKPLDFNTGKPVFSVQILVGNADVQLVDCVECVECVEFIEFVECVECVEYVEWVANVECIESI